MFPSRNSLACFFLVFGLKSRARKKGMNDVVGAGAFWSLGVLGLPK
jgi:hypothetical protein